MNKVYCYCLFLAILDGEVTSLYFLEHPLEPGWCSEEGLLGSHFKWLVISYRLKVVSVQVCVEVIGAERRAFPGQCLGSCFVPSWMLWMWMQQVDHSAELLHQGLLLNCLPPAWWVLLGQSIWCTTLLRLLFWACGSIGGGLPSSQEVPEWLWLHYRVSPSQGKIMTLADTLSRLPNPKDLRVDGIEMTTVVVHRCDVDLVNFSQRKQHQLWDQTARDSTWIMETIIKGRHDSIKGLPTDVWVFWSFHIMLAVEDGIIFKGKQVLIPESPRADILARLHQSHHGIEKTQLLAREGVYWPNKDIEQMTRTCIVCQELANCNRKESLPHTTWHTDGPLEETGHGLVQGRWGAFPAISQNIP